MAKPLCRDEPRSRASPEPASLLTWSKAWDAKEPGYPSHVFLSWYGLLRSLDTLLQRRQAWQRDDESSPPKQPPSATLSSSALALWNLLEKKAIPLNAEYHDAIFRPLHEPLLYRIDQLLDGVVQLPLESATDDILEQLPNIAHPNLSSEYAFPQPARDLLLSSFTNRPTPEALAQLLEDRTVFETTATALQPGFAAAGHILSAAKVAPDAPIKMLSNMRGDYNLMIARRFLELTGDEKTSRKFIDLSGSVA